MFPVGPRFWFWSILDMTTLPVLNVPRAEPVPTTMTLSETGACFCGQAEEYRNHVLW